MSTLTPDRAVTRCGACGQEDDHPMVHIGLAVPQYDGDGQITGWHEDLVHHDCTTPVQRAAILGGVHSQHALITAKIFKESLAGCRGDELVDFIAAQEMPPESGLDMILSTATANAVADALLNGGASGTVNLGAVALALPYKIKFLSTVSTISAAGTEWSTSGGYTAGGVSLSGAAGTAASAGAKANTAAITVTNAPAGTWADNEIVDSTGTPVRVMAKGTPSLAKTVNSGDTCTIPIGSLTVTAA